MAEPWQLILVDSASTDSTYQLLNEFCTTFGPRCEVLRATRKGSGHAKNVGLRAASAPVVSYLDDDCYAERDFLAQVLNCFREQPSLGYLGGRIELFDPDDLPVTIKTFRERVDFPAGAVLRAGEIHGANMSFRRDILCDTGGFDDMFGAGTPFPCEDIDVLARIALGGTEGAYDPRPVVYHHHRRRTEKDRSELMRGYDRGRGAFFAKMLVTGRLVYARHWMSRIRHGSFPGSLREITGALHWLVRRYIAGD